MHVFDIIVAVALVGLGVRGWIRGLVREAIEIGVLLLGVVVVFRFSPVVGSVVAGMANVPFEMARIGAGVFLFLCITVGGAFLAKVLSGAMKIVPGATTLNRIGGAGLGVVYGCLLVVLVATVGSVAPMPGDVKANVDEALSESRVGSIIVDPDGEIQQAVASISGERIFSAVIALQDAVGDRLAAGTVPLPLPDIGEATLSPSQSTAQHVFDDINRERIANGADPLGWSADLAVVAVGRASDVYRSGQLALDDQLSASLTAKGVPGTIHDEMVVLAASTDGIFEAIDGARTYRSLLADTRFHVAGVGVVDGPYGLMAVVVLSA